MQPNNVADAGSLALEFRELGRHIDAGGGLEQSLPRIVNLACQFVEGCDWAAVTGAANRPRTMAASHDVARQIDEVQIAEDDGPCLTAARDDVIIHVPDLASETRWPRFCARALQQTPLQALLSFEVQARPSSPVALNLYASRVDPFDDQAIATAALFATHTQLALMHLSAATNSTNLRQALTTSRLIGEAVGVLMANRKVTSAQAFDLLRSSSQNLNRKLRDVAIDVTDTGELPTTRR